MPLEDHGEHSTKIGSDRKIPPLVQLCRGETGPFPINPATVDGTSQDPDRISVTVIGATITVVPNGAAELG